MAFQLRGIFGKFSGKIGQIQGKIVRNKCIVTSLPKYPNRIRPVSFYTYRVQYVMPSANVSLFDNGLIVTSGITTLRGAIWERKVLNSDFEMYVYVNQVTWNQYNYFTPVLGSISASIPYVGICIGNPVSVNKIRVFVNQSIVDVSQVLAIGDTIRLKVNNDNSVQVMHNNIVIYSFTFIRVFPLYLMSASTRTNTSIIGLQVISAYSAKVL